MGHEFLKLVINNIAEIVFALIGMLITVYLVPYLKEKKLYDKVKTAVNAAEKLSQSCNINKSEWVIENLSAMGIKITPLLKCMIESAVIELDALLQKSAK